MEEHIKALMTIVVEQGKTIIEMKECLTHLNHFAFGKEEQIDTTPVSEPTPTVQNDYIDGRKKLNEWRSSMRSKKPPLKEDANPNYTPPIYVIDVNDHDAIYHR